VRSSLRTTFSVQTECGNTILRDRTTSSSLAPNYGNSLRRTAKD
jgi:hypothetical protein